MFISYFKIWYNIIPLFHSLCFQIVMWVERAFHGLLMEAWTLIAMKLWASNPPYWHCSSFICPGIDIFSALWNMLFLLQLILLERDILVWSTKWNAKNSCGGFGLGWEVRYREHKCTRGRSFSGGTHPRKRTNE